MHPAGPLGSTGITPLPSYYEPLRLPAAPPRRLWLRAGPWVPPKPPGLPGSSVNLSARAVSNHPARPAGCNCPLLRQRYQASTYLEAWPPGISVSRPNRVCLRYGSRLRLRRLRRTGRPGRRSLGYMCERAIHMVDSFHSTRLTRLGLAHRMNADGCGRNALRFLRTANCEGVSQRRRGR